MTASGLLLLCLFLLPRAHRLLYDPDGPVVLGDDEGEGAIRVSKEGGVVITRPREGLQTRVEKGEPGGGGDHAGDRVHSTHASLRLSTPSTPPWDAGHMFPIPRWH